MEPFLGEIRLFSIGFTPKGWAACEGQLLPLKNNVALFSLLGTQYGGDGTTTFALPDLRGRVPVHCGSTYKQGVAAGEATHTLTISEMPAHNHVILASTAPVNSTLVSGNTWGSFAAGYDVTPNIAMDPHAIAASGGNQPHNNMQPFLALNFCIAVQGLFPSRN